MAVSRALRRLLRIRDLEEEQCRLALESALAELRRLEHALKVRWAGAGRPAIALCAAHTRRRSDRLAGLQQSQSAERAKRFERRMAEVGFLVGELRRVFLAKRVERRQAQTLIDETEERDRVEAARRGQQALDDRYGSRLHGEKTTPALP